ncbi:MAG: hypothetical protein HN904_17555 [Victivallales bacterium]|nr:hypothetical protein [Victivallales bacterium]MBT7164591.1 hypothetical protein [Victivallales bacterium]
MKIQTLVRTTAAGLMCLSVAMAQPAKGEGRGPRGKKDPAKLFARIDADSSGIVTLEELKASHEKRMAARKEHGGERPERPERPEGGERKRPTVEEVFGRMDADDSGGITVDEFTAALAKRAERRQGKGGKRGGRRGARKDAE